MAEYGLLTKFGVATSAEGKMLVTLDFAGSRGGKPGQIDFEVTPSGLAQLARGIQEALRPDGKPRISLMISN